MADITRRRQGEMIQALFKILGAAPEGMAARAAIEQTATTLGMSDYETGTYNTGPVPVRRFDKILRFSTISAVKAGWLVKDKGTWSLTELGVEALAAHPDPEDLMQTAGRLYRDWKRTQPDAAPASEDTDVEVDHLPSVLMLEEAEDAARTEIQDYLTSIPPYDFQELVAALLRAMGYHVAWIAPPGPDRGIDIVAYTDPLGATGPRIKVQVKRRSDRIAVQEVRSFMAVLSATDVGIFVSRGGFTADAHTEARHQENRRISLLGTEELLELWVAHYAAIPEEHRALLPLKPVYFLAQS
jgi:restriction system protein